MNIAFIIEIESEMCQKARKKPTFLKRNKNPSHVIFEFNKANLPVLNINKKNVFFLLLLWCVETEVK